MKKEFTKPIFEVIEFTNKDILLTSGSSCVIECQCQNVCNNASTCVVEVHHQ